MSRIDSTTPKLAQRLAALDAKCAVPDCWEWWRENGQHVKMVVESGEPATLRTWINDVEQEPQQCEYAVAVRIVEELSLRDLIR